MTRHIEDAQLDKIHSRIRGRRAAAEMWDLLDTSEQQDKSFMSACLDQLMIRAGLAGPQPDDEKHEPIERMANLTIPFGRYKGRLFEEVPLDYLDWLCREQEGFYRDLRAYLRHPQLEAHRGEYDYGED